MFEIKWCYNDHVKIKLKMHLFNVLFKTRKNAEYIKINIRIAKAKATVKKNRRKQTEDKKCR